MYSIWLEITWLVFSKNKSIGAQSVGGTLKSAITEGGEKAYLTTPKLQFVLPLFQLLPTGTTGKSLFPWQLAQTAW